VLTGEWDEEQELKERMTSPTANGEEHERNNQMLHILQEKLMVLMQLMDQDLDDFETQPLVDGALPDTSLVDMSLVDMRDTSLGDKPQPHVPHPLHLELLHLTPFDAREADDHVMAAAVHGEEAAVQEVTATVHEKEEAEVEEEMVRETEEGKRREAIAVARVAAVEAQENKRELDEAAETIQRLARAKIESVKLLTHTGQLHGGLVLQVLHARDELAQAREDELLRVTAARKKRLLNQSDAAQAVSVVTPRLLKQWQAISEPFQHLPFHGPSSSTSSLLDAQRAAARSQAQVEKAQLSLCRQQARNEHLRALLLHHPAHNGADNDAADLTTLVQAVESDEQATERQRDESDRREWDEQSSDLSDKSETSHASSESGVMLAEMDALEDKLQVCVSVCLRECGCKGV